MAMIGLPIAVLGQGFGQNKVQYENFEWKLAQSEHFDVYFTEGGEDIAQFVAETAEKAYESLSKDFLFELSPDDRIIVVTYKSHNDFEQTNVSFDQPEESVGGFTEFFKNRVVVPFEGSYEDFRHVVHHEVTHAVMLRMLFGSGIQSIVAGITRAQLPLWFIEGLAEYESRYGWDIESDMFIRDASINGYLPPIQELGGYLNYKGGQSVLYYLAQRYGRQKIGEILNKLRTTRDTNKAFKAAIGIDLEELSKRWHKYLRKTHWPALAAMHSPEDFAERLTDHTEDRNFVNTSPAISPRGDKLAFLSDRSDYFDIYLMSTLDGKIIRKLVAGQRRARFEELHWQRPGISWAPTGDRITFAAKAGGKDAIYIIDAENGKILNEYTFDLEGVFSPSWSPKGDRIAFVGSKNGYSNIYAVVLPDGQLVQYTRDSYSDLDPCWSLDGGSIVFASDRRGDLSIDGNDVQMFNHDYRQLDLYMLDVSTHTLKRLTDTPHQERTPVFAPEGMGITYVSDENGAYNLFNMNLENNESKPLTNVLTGCFQPSWSRAGRRLVFTAFYDWGYDIYLYKNPLEAPDIELPLTAFVQEKPLPLITDVREEESESEEETSKPFAQFVFGDTPALSKLAVEDTTDYRTEDGDYRVKPYRLKFSPDIVYANAAYSTFFGFQGSGQILFSDVLGNHLIYITTDLYYDFENSNFSGFYYYLPRRIDYGIGFYHNVYFFDGGDIRDRNYGGSAFLSYPLSKYNRLELSMDMLFIDRSTWDFFKGDYEFWKRRRVFMPGLAYVHDTVVWGSTGPMNGSRYRLAFYYSPDLEGESNDSDRWGLDFRTVIADYRRYWRIGSDYSFATRVAAGFSEGETPQRFYLGGVRNWINRKFAEDIPSDSIEEIYFSSLVLPFRGAEYYAKKGTRFAITNVEFRFPLIRYILLGWPLPAFFHNVRGALFTDIGSAWNQDHFRGTVRGDDGLYHLNDILMGYGTGTRVNLGFFLIQWDVAWSTDLVDSSKPKYYFSLGAEF
ncbi:hypothetical protein AMJ86_02075 [bacterium SM23_57]|nr:MAG: hypothetical protein AMJ86_02075 [bacterium SM23_57]